MTFACRGQSIQPSADHVANTLGYTDVADVAAVGPSTVPLIHRTRLGEVAEHLAHEERVALGLVMDGEGERLCAFVELVPCGGLDELGHFVPVEATQGEALHVVVAAEITDHRGERMTAVHVGVPVGDDDEDAAGTDPAGEVAQHEQRRLLGPVGVVDDEHHRRLARETADPSRDGLEEPELLRRGVGTGGGRQVSDP